MYNFCVPYTILMCIRLSRCGNVSRWRGHAWLKSPVCVLWSAVTLKLLRERAVVHAVWLNDLTVFLPHWDAQAHLLSGTSGLADSVECFSDHAGVWPRGSKQISRFVEQSLFVSTWPCLSAWRRARFFHARPGPTAQALCVALTHT